MTRLDRLFVLLESGSTAATRKAAALQLGEVQRLHPHELPFILSRVHKCLRSPSWETRVAAGLAVEAILSKIPQWSPSKDHDELTIDDASSDSKPLLTFSTFSLPSVLSASSSYLMASEAKVFETKLEEPATQRSIINKRLGLDVAEKMGIDTTDIVSNEDLLEPPTPTTPGPNANAFCSSAFCTTPTGASHEEESSSSHGLQLFDPNLEEQMSSREINLLKRKAKKQKQREQAQEAAADNKRLKKEDSLDLESSSIYTVAEGAWPLSAWVDILINDLFSPSWEIRHGSATALREVVKQHGLSTGPLFLEDLSLRLVSVLALDRFGDFISDQVVAPVRETASQCLGAVVTLLAGDGVASLVQILVELLHQESWEVRHGALLGLKYIFAVRRDLLPKLLPLSFSSIYKCLQDSVDDVTAVAAGSLIPIADLLVETLPQNCPSVVSVLWDSLGDLDELSSACNSIMSLLATLLTFPKARSNLRELDILIPRLWQFLHHTSSSVRKSALITLQKLTELDPSVAPMSVGPLQETLRHVYQRGLVEHVQDVQLLIPQIWSDLLKSSRLENLLLAACPYFGNWLCLAMQPPRVPIDPISLLQIVKKTKKDQENEGENGEDPSAASKDKIFMGGSGDGDPKVVAGSRLRLTKMLGEIASYIVLPLPNGSNNLAEEPIELFVRVLMVHLNSRSALQRSTTSFVISSWPEPPPLNGSKGKKGHPGLCKKLQDCLNESVYFDEIALGFTKMQSECRDFIATLRHYKVPLPTEIQNAGGNNLFSLQQIAICAGEGMVELIQKNLKKPKLSETLLERRKTIWALWNQTTMEFAALNIMTLAALASAVVSIGAPCLPVKLNPVVKPLMESIRREENVLFQKTSAEHLCILIELALSREPCPNSKIIQNLILYLCVEQQNGSTGTASSENGADILSLSCLTGAETKKLTKLEELAEIEANKGNIIQKRGATLALCAIVRYFGPALESKVPKLWELTFGVLDSEEQTRETVLNALLVLEIISPSFHNQLHPNLTSHIGKLCSLLNNKDAEIRHMASRTLAVWTQLIPNVVMPIVAKEVLPRFESGANDLARQGALEAVWCIVDKLGLNLLPYIVLLVVPVLGRMSDQNESVRLLASLTFATLVRLMPLEGGVPDPPNLPVDLSQQKGEQREFLEQLLNPSKIPKYEITVPINAELRPYQQQGVNWLGFLNKFKLHGILCDDMGLGKTLQSICILGSDHKEVEERYERNKCEENLPLPSIVICPPTLTGHWVYEVEKFISSTHLSPLHYHGPPTERNKLKPRLAQHNLVVASYDIVRNDIDFFSSIRWNYCILDEGHIIKNGKTKISKAIKQLKSKHRLILSGTPIQNNVLELWSLFDFLMPGFLGSEKQFSVRFGRPILLARDPKCSPKEQEGGALAMEALHRQALPFLLRRLKEDVLQDLPPKITQDYYCDLSPVQEQLYEDFARTRAHQSLRDTFHSNDNDPSKHSHIFQALQYLRKVCNHPKLVLTPQHPQFHSVMKSLQQGKTTLDDISNSAKLPALKQLLLDCGIGVTETNSDNFVVVGQHRALIFCQLKVMLDILEHDLFKVHMPSVTFLRLDGGVPAGQRHSLVTRFNNDPSIDVLLLTTQVGGLGLNLTGADTVIFVEHDWNPMRDLQAMDRAHRIGQKKVVNVYRLITRGTLEEKIMGLQKFKLMTANTVINQENSSIETMATDQLLDLFVLDEDNKDKGKKEDVGGIVGAYKNVLENLPELWEDKLYEEEYDLSSFIKNLGK